MLLLSFSCRTYNSSESGEGCQPETEKRKQGKAVPALLSLAPSFWCSYQCCMSLSPFTNLVVERLMGWPCSLSPLQHFRGLACSSD